MKDVVPKVGESFRDTSGTHWRVETVTASERLAGFYLVRLAYGPTPACDAGRCTLDKGEYLALQRDKGFRRAAE